MIYNSKYKLYVSKEGLLFRVVDDKLVECKYTDCNGYLITHKGRVHRIVWETFNGEIPTGYHIHHIDHNRQNNKLSNLECVNGSEHIRNHKKGTKLSEITKLKISEHSKSGTVECKIKISLSKGGAFCKKYGITPNEFIKQHNLPYSRQTLIRKFNKGEF